MLRLSKDIKELEAQESQLLQEKLKKQKQGWRWVDNLKIKKVN